MDITSYLLGKNSAGGGGGGGSDLDWTAIGYDSTPQSIINEYNYAKEIYDNWVSTTDLSSKFRNDTEITIMPLVDTSEATTMYQMFEYCSNLVSVPILDTKNVTNMRAMFDGCTNLKYVPILDTSNLANNGINQMFSSCNKLTDDALNNILQMCINATKLTTKTLATVGFYSSKYPATRIQALSNYQAFIDAGWTIGY